MLDYYALPALVGYGCRRGEGLAIEAPTREGSGSQYMPGERLEVRPFPRPHATLPPYQPATLPLRIMGRALLSRPRPGEWNQMDAPKARRRLWPAPCGKARDQRRATQNQPHGASRVASEGHREGAPVAGRGTSSGNAGEGAVVQCSASAHAPMQRIRVKDEATPPAGLICGPLVSQQA